MIQRKAVQNVNARLGGSELRVSAPAAVPGDVLEPVVRDLARKLLCRVDPRAAERGLRCRQESTP
ncbi:MAG: hypothetical protein IRZ26_08555 [Clostridia bacterium]|nr:hypothetical protein [Clostridia bacterium]MCL6521755.1 hypothetical protein [Bacillota bacterium]